MMTHNIDIQHQPEQRRFILDFEKHQAVLEYALETNPAGITTIDFYSTYVPPEFRGKGFAEKLVRHGMAWARRQNYVMQASCWYAEKFLRD